MKKNNWQHYDFCSSEHSAHWAYDHKIDDFVKGATGKV